MKTIRRYTWHRVLTVSLLAFAFEGLATSDLFGQGAKKSKELTIGSNAPALDIEHWVFNGEGKFQKVKKFESGKVYVVEFWATTCGPCIESIPHLVELQKQYADKGLQIIGVSSEPLDLVKEFLSTKARDSEGKPTTIGELGKKYCLTTDPDGSVEEDYMLAAKQNAIPTAFVVGKDSKIEWIGHPNDLDEIVESVIEGNWDREKYKAEQALFAEIQSTLEKLSRGKKFKEAVAALDGFLVKVDEPQIKFMLLKAKIEMQLAANAAGEAVSATFNEVLKLASDEPLFVQDIAWTAYEYFVEEKLADKELLKSCLKAMQKSLTSVQGPVKSNILDSIAHIQFVLEDISGAIQSQEEAVKLADSDDKPVFEEFLKELKSEKK